VIRQPFRRKWPRVVLGLLAVGLLLGGYTYLSHRQHIENPEDTTIPSWSQLKEGVVKAVQPHPRSGERWVVVDSKATLSRLFLGLLCGVLGAVFLGILMGCSATVEALLVPPLSLFAQVPPTAMLAVFFVLVGTDTEMYVAMIAFGVLPTLAQTVHLSVRDVPEELLYKAYTLGASHAEVVWNVIVRHMLPKLIDAVRLQFGPAMVFLIAAEMVVGDVGFGYRIRLLSRLLDMGVVYPYLFYLMMFGFLMNVGMKQLQRLVCRWHDGGRRSS